MGTRRRTSNGEPVKPIPVPRPPRTDGKRTSARKDACRRLGLASLPSIDRLALDAIRVVGTKAKFIDYARHSPDERITELVEKYDALSASDRDALAVVDLCAAVDLPFSLLLGAVAAHAYEHNSDVSRLVASVNQPKVVAATVKSAIEFIGPDGWKDRQMLLTHSNFLPVPKSSDTIFKFQQLISNGRANLDADDEPTGLPSFESDIVSFSQAQRAKTLPLIDGKP